eukprot:545260-Pelagomonas_calceolata.AAC.2
MVGGGMAEFSALDPPARSSPPHLLPLLSALEKCFSRQTAATRKRNERARMLARKLAPLCLETPPP